MGRSNSRSSQSLPLLMCLILSSLCACLESTPARRVSYPMTVSEVSDVKDMTSSSNGYFLPSAAYENALFRDGYADHSEDDLANDEDDDIEKRRLRFHKRRLRFNKRRLRFQKKDAPFYWSQASPASSLPTSDNSPAMFYADDGGLYQRELRAPRLRFYSLRKRAADENEISEGHNTETNSDTHSRSKRSAMPSLANLGGSLEPGISKRISINQDLKAIADMLIAEQKEARRIRLAALRKKLMNLGKRGSDARVVTRNEDDDEERKVELLLALGAALEQQ